MKKTVAAFVSATLFMEARAVNLRDSDQSINHGDLKTEVELAEVAAATENPTFAGAGEASSDVDVEAGLKDGTLSAEQAVLMMEARLES